MIILDKEVTPTYTDLISFGGVDHTVVDIDEVNHAGITQIWKVTVRG
jgi:predicted RNA-binding protein associated with RNAse of E/G family